MQYFSSISKPFSPKSLIGGSLNTRLVSHKLTVQVLYPSKNSFKFISDMALYR